MKRMSKILPKIKISSINLWKVLFSQKNSTKDSSENSSPPINETKRENAKR
jgi:hypothetical protein